MATKTVTIHNTLQSQAGFYKKIPNVADESAAILLRMQEDQVQNLTVISAVLTGNIDGFPKYLQENIGLIPENDHGHFLSYPFQYPGSKASFEDMCSELSLTKSSK
jgi:hypothetical protein